MGKTEVLEEITQDLLIVRDTIYIEFEKYAEDILSGFHTDDETLTKTSIIKAAVCYEFYLAAEKTLWKYRAKYTKALKEENEK